ncbi:MAG: amino acid permease [Sporomusaceae bacterium]|nr:amino acid permease [Sporomusaceae bacterium]
MNEDISLKKSITWLQGSAMTIGAVLGAGILVLPAITASLAGPASLLSWLFTGLLSLPMIAVIGMISSKFPDSGGLATYVHTAYGSLAGQLTSLLMLTAMPFGMPVTALIGANYLGSVFNWTQGNIHIAAACLILTAIALNYRGIELSGKTQIGVVLSILLILTIAIISALPALTVTAFTPFLPYGWLPVGGAMSFIFFAFMGWEMIGNLAEEFKNPRKDLPLSLLISVIVINFIYLAVAFVTVGTNVYQSESPLTAMITLTAYRWGDHAKILVALLGFIACYCPLHTFIAGFSRLVYAQSRNGAFPACFSQLHSRYQTPHRALLAFVPLYLFILLLSYSLSWNLYPLINIPSANFLAVYFLAMSAATHILSGKAAKGLACISTLFALILFLFSGWFTLYSLAVAALLFSYKLYQKYK